MIKTCDEIWVYNLHIEFSILAGPVNGPAKMQHIVDKNQDILNSFIKAVEELAILRDNLLKTEVSTKRVKFNTFTRDMLD